MVACHAQQQLHRWLMLLDHMQLHWSMKGSSWNYIQYLNLETEKYLQKGWMVAANANKQQSGESLRMTWLMAMVSKSEVSSTHHIVCNDLNVFSEFFSHFNNCYKIQYQFAQICRICDMFQRMMAVNYIGSVYTTRAVICQMKSRQTGRIVFVSSQAGQLGMFGYSGYSPTKYALRGFAEALQMEVYIIWP